MTRRSFLALAGAGTVAAAAPRRVPRPRRRSERPNLVLIMADDMGWSDIGAFGGEIRTPNLDRLARGGLRMTQFYNAARCCPTRAALLTGLNPHQAGMGHMANGRSSADYPDGQPYQGFLSRNAATLAEVLRPAGYRTFMSGKWHVGGARPDWPCDRGFEHYFGLISGAANYFDPTRDANRILARDLTRLRSTPADFYLTDAVSDYACEVIDACDDGPEPFLLYVAYTAPHWPLHARREDAERYRERYRDGWEPLRAERHRRQLDEGLVSAEWGLSPADGPSWESVADKPAQSWKMALYAGMVDRLDQGIGRIIDALERHDELDNTLICFLSDNGGCHEGGPLGFDQGTRGAEPGGRDSWLSYGQGWANASNTPFRKFKHWTHEGGISSPFIAHWPAGIAPGRTDHQVASLMDIMPTFRELGRAEYPETCNGRAITPCEGRSLVPILRGGAREPHPALCWEHEANRAVRAGDWKLVAEAGRPWELYNLAADRTELHDEAAAQPARAAELAGLWEAWADRVGARKPA